MLEIAQLHSACSPKRVWIWHFVSHQSDKPLQKQQKEGSKREE